MKCPCPREDFFYTHTLRQFIHFQSICVLAGLMTSGQVRFADITKDNLVALKADVSETAGLEPAYGRF